MRNLGKYIYDYAHSFFRDYFQSNALHWYIGICVCTHRSSRARNNCHKLCLESKIFLTLQNIFLGLETKVFLRLWHIFLGLESKIFLTLRHIFLSLESKIFLPLFHIYLGLETKIFLPLFHIYLDLDTKIFLTLRHIFSVTRSVVLNLGSIEPQGFGESVTGVRRQEILSNQKK